MATFQGNTPMTQAQISHQITLAEKRKRQEKLDADLRRVEFRESTKYFCENIIKAATRLDVTDPWTLKEFHLFPKLPVELRLKIWRRAIDTPRVIVYRRYTYACANRNPPPVFFKVCQESKEETILAYDKYHSATAECVSSYVPTNRWLRFDQDILHITPVEGEHAADLAIMSKVFARPGLLNSFISQWNDIPSRNRTTSSGSDKWIYRPESFHKIQHVAISRDLLHHLPDDYEPFVRHMFPNLLTLIVLIDEGIDIDTKWNIFDLEYRRYEQKVPMELRNEDNPRGIPRLDFAKKTVGPFKEVKLNIDYRMEIEFEMRRRFAKEEDDYNWYTAPRIRVLGGFIPEGVEVEDCGLLPFKLDEKEKIKKHTEDPFR